MRIGRRKQKENLVPNGRGWDSGCPIMFAVANHIFAPPDARVYVCGGAFAFYHPTYLHVGRHCLGMGGGRE